MAGRTQTKRLGGSQPSLSRSCCLTGLALLWLTAATAPARADAAAGREAFEKGDYKHAMTEWQSAANRNDPDAEFGLGSLYEFGAGDLKQNYKQADYWYRKAAALGNIEAQYRLALIWATGGDDLAADLAEAYKWAALAVESEGVWSAVAADLKSQLDRVTSPGQRADGERRARIWREEQTAKKEEPPGTTAPPSQPSAPVAKAPSTGCPGWPFPTLPCTEQFPALPGTQPPPRAPSPQRPVTKAPIEELNEALTQIDCAALRSRISAQGSVSISGTVSDARQKTKLIELAERLFPNERPEVAVDIVKPPLCRSMVELRDMRAAGLISEGGLGLRLNSGSSQLREGDPIKLEVRGPAYPINLRIDYFSLDGRVLHLSPDPNNPAPKLAAGAARVFSQSASGQPWGAGGAPFGSELICVIATAVPIDLGSRAQVEQAADYLRDLRRVLSQASAPAAQPNVVATLLVETHP
jgi:hypothetical protein